MASGLDRVRGIETFGYKLVRKVLKITLVNAAFVRNVFLFTVLVANAHLILVYCDSCDIGTSELLDIPHWTANSTTNIKHF
jgi:hypothetical protein